MGSLYKLQKWTRSGELVRFVGSDVHGSEEGKFNEPCGVTVYNDEVYMCVCDNHNHPIQVFDLGLNFV